MLFSHQNGSCGLEFEGQLCICIRTGSKCGQLIIFALDMMFNLFVTQNN